MLQHLCNQPGRAPAIDKNVVMGPDQPVTLVIEPDQAHPLQRRLRDVEATLAFPPGYLRQRGIQFRAAAVAFEHCRPVAPILFDERYLHMTVHHLLGRAGQALPHKTGPQGGVPITHRLPRHSKLAGIKAKQLKPDLVHIGIVVAIPDRMEQHALLHRRKRIDVLDAAEIQCRRQPIEVDLTEAGQHNVRRRETKRSAAAMRHQFPQGRLVKSRQPFDRLAPIALAPISEGQLQTSFTHHTGDVQPSSQRSSSAARRTCALERKGEALGSTQAAIEPAEVVENDLRLRQLRQGIALVLGAEIAQHAIAKAAVRDRAQLLLDRLDQGGVVARRSMEPHREGRREPAHGTRNIRTGKYVLAAVAFEFDRQIVALAPARDGARQARQHQIVDLRPIGCGRVLQQPRRQFGIEDQRHLFAVTDEIDAAMIIVAWQAWTRPTIEPERQFVGKLSGRRVGM